MKPFLASTLFVVAFGLAAISSLWATKPNIVLILADDMGLGDVSCYGTGGLVETPYLDKLASEGRRFLDAHTPSGVCNIWTPDRPLCLARGKSCVLQGYSPLTPGAKRLPPCFGPKGTPLQSSASGTSVLVGKKRTAPLCLTRRARDPQRH